jgi:hypothetical protein
VFTHGKEPWPLLSNVEAAERVAGGKRCLIGEKFGTDFDRDLQTRCYKRKPTSRPTFAELEAELADQVAMGQDAQEMPLYNTGESSGDTSTPENIYNTTPRSGTPQDMYQMSPSFSRKNPRVKALRESANIYSYSPDVSVEGSAANSESEMSDESRDELEQGSSSSGSGSDLAESSV